MGYGDRVKHLVTYVTHRKFVQLGEVRRAEERAAPSIRLFCYPRLYKGTVGLPTTKPSVRTTGH